MEDDGGSDDDMRGGSLTPGPTQPCNREAFKSNSAIFIKVFDRGERNQCARTDFTFLPLPESNLAKKRRQSHSNPVVIKEERGEKSKRVETPPRAPSVSSAQKTSTSNSHTPSSSSGPGGHGSGGPYQERITPRPSFTDTPALRQLHEYARPHVLGKDIYAKK